MDEWLGEIQIRCVQLRGGSNQKLGFKGLISDIKVMSVMMPRRYYIIKFIGIIANTGYYV